MSKALVIGGAGFVGSHIVDRLLEGPAYERIVVYDNFSSGKREHLQTALTDSRVTVVTGEIDETHELSEWMKGMDTVFHLAANPDIALAEKRPSVDFLQGTMLLWKVIEVMRLRDVKRLYYMSGSGVYGDQGETILKEDSPLRPISTYGASKMACEGMIAAYCHMFGFNAACFRFANIIGARQTHGVGYDFIRKLKSNRDYLDIRGDGFQSKSYLHVWDAINAIFTVPLEGFEVYNVATEDYISVDQIARMAAEVMGVTPELRYTGGRRGWAGDVPVVRFDSTKIRALGWEHDFTSVQAMQLALEALRDDL